MYVVGKSIALLRRPRRDAAVVDLFHDRISSSGALAFSFRVYRSEFTNLVSFWGLHSVCTGIQLLNFW